MALKEPKGVEEILEKILSLKEEIVQKQNEIESLKSRLSVKDEKPTPKGFEYKEAILSVFSKSAGAELRIDDVADEVRRSHDFTPDRTVIANRMNYLVDRDPKLERVEGKRGFYRLKTETAQQEAV